jgi:hypothetical protein
MIAGNSVVTWKVDLKSELPTPRFVVTSNGVGSSDIVANPLSDIRHLQVAPSTILLFAPKLHPRRVSTAGE